MDIIQKIQINADPSTIYLALTSQKGIENWWAKNCVVGLKVGGISKMVFTKEGKKIDMHFRIDELHTDKKVVWTCLHNTNPAWLNTHISFEIMNHHKPFELMFKHSKFPDGYKSDMENQSWGHFLNSLKKYCETGAGEAWG
ncbi:MAG: SRPBCC domain-containing protein [Bacteroidota bacterium]